MTKPNITKGEWKTCRPEDNSDELTYVYVESGKQDDVVCDCFGLMAGENAKLISEAGTVYNETGLTTREPLDLARDLRGALRECHVDLHKFAHWSNAKTRAWEAIKKSEAIK